MSVHTTILCDKCKNIIGTRSSNWDGKIMILKDEKHKCEEMLFKPLILDKDELER